MIRLLIGLALAPTSALALYAAAQALAALAADSPPAAPFLGGFALAALVRIFVDFGASRFARALSAVYVFGHELTHAVAAWAFGASVTGFKAGADGGHVDLSHSNAVIALAPYCVPLYTVAVVLAYRVLLYARPGAASAWHELFLVLLGLSFAFHAIFTWDSVVGRKQPDLDAAGGVVFSLAVIALSNAVVTVGLLKTLFPSFVSLRGAFWDVKDGTIAFWMGAAELARRTGWREAISRNP